MKCNLSQTFVFLSKHILETISILGFFLGLEQLFDVGPEEVKLKHDPEKSKIEDNLRKREHHPRSKVERMIRVS